MGLSIRVDGLDAHGVSLLSPLRPEFDELARPLMGERIADVGLRLKPLLVIVSNETAQTIVSLSLIWRVRRLDGWKEQSWCHTSFPELVCGDVLEGRETVGLAPGHQRVEANGLVIHGYGHGDPYYDQFLGQFVDKRDALLAGAVNLEVSLDAVIFDDGTLIGADEESRLSNLFSAYVRAKQDWYRGISQALDAGQSAEEAFGPVERFMEERMNRMRSGKFRLRDQMDDIWTQQAAAEAMGWRKQFSDDEMPARLKQSIRLGPFVIRRRSTDPA
jgi:hypothetical protein